MIKNTKENLWWILRLKIIVFPNLLKTTCYKLMTKIMVSSMNNLNKIDQIVSQEK